jgi:hypothetical protein
MCFCYIHFGVIQRSKGYTSLARLAYQTCAFVNDGFRRMDYWRYAAHHLGGLVLLPRHAPAELADLGDFVMAVASRETRRNAQEGRIVDFAIPRQVPRELLLAVATFTLLPFVEVGMAIRVDVECPLATDGEPNPHAHAYLAMRRVDRYGFGPKERAWNELFRRDGGRHVRAIIAARLTLACAVLGIDAYVDPRRNEARGADTPEDRLSQVLFRMHDAGKSVEEIEQLKARRRLKKARKVPQKAPEVTSGLTITNAVAYHDDKEKVVAFRKRFSDKAEEVGYQVETSPGEREGLSTLSLAGTSVSFDGCTFRLKDECNAEDAEIVALFARIFDWPALVVEGDAQLTDLMAITAASVGVFMVNRSPSADARQTISEAHIEKFKTAIARRDRLGVVAKSLADFAPGSAAAPAATDIEEVFAPSATVTDLDLEPATVEILSDEFSVQPSAEVVMEPGSDTDPGSTTPADGTSGTTTDRSAMDPVIVSSAPSVDDLETLPDDNSWQIKPGPQTLAQNARYLKANHDRVQRQAEDAEEIARRMRDRLPGKNPRPP